MQIYMNTWKNYNENGADLSAYGINSIADGWMDLDDAIEFANEHAEDEPFINDTDDVPSVFEVNEYSPVISTLEKLKRFDEMGGDEDIIEAIMESGYDFDEAFDKFESGDYLWYPGATTETELAYAVIDSIGSLEDALGDRVTNYIDEEQMRSDYEWDVREMMRDDASSAFDDEFKYSDEEEIPDKEDWIEDWIDSNLNSYLDSVIDEEVAMAERGEIDLSNYFDYEQFGRDLTYDGYVFTDKGAILVN